MTETRGETELLGDEPFPGRGHSEQVRRLVVPALRAWVSRLPPEIRVVAEYHFGWRDSSGAATRAGDRAVGKLVRPRLVLDCARAARDAGGAQDSGDTEAAVRSAVAMELVHNFSLLHDDVIDRDETRRHRPTVWRVFGVPTAVLLGDALLCLAFRALAEEPDDERAACTVRLLSDAVVELSQGESADVAFERRAEVTVAECLEMEATKTGALMGAACGIGALAGGADRERTGRLIAFGRHLGAAFQAVDDLLGIYGDPRRTGKPVGADLAARKKSLPVVTALTSPHPAGAELRRLYRGTGPMRQAEVRHAAALVAAAGGREEARRLADRHTRQALACLRAALPDPGAAAALVALTDLLTDRGS